MSQDCENSTAVSRLLTGIDAIELKHIKRQKPQNRTVSIHAIPKEVQRYNMYCENKIP